MSLNDINIAIISETWLKKEEKIFFKGYTTNVSSRSDGYGGVAVITKNNIQHKANTVEMFKPIELIEIKTTNLDKNLTIVSIYIPPNITAKEVKIKFKQMIQYYNNVINTIIAGDINAHNSLWEHNSKNDQKGKDIAEIILDSNFYVLNNGDHTYNCKQHNNTSAIDITLAHADIAIDIFWQNTYENLTSDHFIIEINQANNKVKNHEIKECIQYKKLEREIEMIKLDQIISIEHYEKEIVNKIRKCTVKNNENNKYVPKYWWNDKIKNYWQIKKEKLKIYNRTKTSYSKELKKITKKLKMEIKKSKYEKFKQFTEEINPSSNIKDIYNKINLFNEKKRKQ